MRRLYDIPPTEAKCLFTYLERLGVTTMLDDYSRQKAIGSLDSLISQVTDWPKSRVIDSVASIILLQLRKSKQIDVDLFNQVIQFYPKIRGPPPSEKAAIVWEDDDDDDDDEEEEDDELPDPEDDDFDLDLFKIDREELEKQKAKQRVPTDQDMEELMDFCSKWGCTLKKGHEQKILNLLIPFLSTNFPIFSCSRRISIQVFFRYYLVDYVDSTCTLKNLETVDYAIERVKKAIEGKKEEEDNREKEQQSYSGLLREITVPTNKEGDTTPMNQFNQEKRENLAEQKEICLTTSVNEQTKEYGNVMTPLKPEEEEEEKEKSRVAIDVCLAPECKDMDIEKPRKRKLEFSHPVSV